MTDFLKIIKWQAHASSSWLALSEDLKTIADAHQAWIVDFKIYSDLALFFKIELEGDQVETFFQDLQKILHFAHEFSSDWKGQKEEEWTILLNISLIGGKGLVEREIPNVPG